jgi:hypothetical protein
MILLKAFVAHGLDFSVVDLRRSLVNHLRRQSLSQPHAARNIREPGHLLVLTHEEVTR